MIFKHVVVYSSTDKTVLNKGSFYTFSQMIQLNIVKERYEQMGDEELIALAQNESQHLTVEAFHLLQLELEKRNIDTEVIDQMQTAKEIEQGNIVSAFEQHTAEQFTETVWQAAFDAKVKGKTDKELFDALLKMNIKEEYAYMLIQSMEQRVKELVEHYKSEMNIGVGFIIAALVLVVLLLNITGRPAISLWSIVLLIYGISRAAKNSKRMKQMQRIADIISEEKERNQQLYQ